MARPHRHRGKWRIRWFDLSGSRRSQSFEAYREAAEELARLEAEVVAVKKGLRPAPPPPKTFNDLCEAWIKYRVPLKRSAADDLSIIRRHLRPAFGKLQLRAINVEHVDAFSVTKRHLSPKTVHNLLTLLSSMLRYAVDLRWLDRAPKIRKPRVRVFERDFRYLRDDQQVQRFLRAARDDGQDTFTLYATALLTGMRQGELAALRWDDVRFDLRRIVVQRSFDGPTKGGDVRYVPLMNELFDVLQPWREVAVGPLVFPNRAGKMHQPCARIFAERLHRVLDAAGFERPTAGRHRHVLNFHSLRHSFASHWMMRGGDLFKLQRILGHKDVKMTLRYAHLAPHAFAEDMGRMAGLVV